MDFIKYTCNLVGITNIKLSILEFLVTGFFLIDKFSQQSLSNLQLHANCPQSTTYNQIRLNELNFSIQQDLKGMCPPTHRNLCSMKT